jgi:alpha,alpha-trehalase
MRSHPPILAGMIKSYVDTTLDLDFALETVATLEQEFLFWTNNHMVTVNGHRLARYGDKSNGPRPESYREDVVTASVFATEEEREALYSELKAGAESGMDYSSRWFIKDGKQGGNLTDIKCRSIIPVELNAFLFWDAQIIAEFYHLAGDLQKQSEYLLKSYEIYAAIQAVLWDEEVGVWLDYNMVNQKRSDFFTPTNLAPLWVGGFNHADKAKITEKVLAYIERTGIDDFPGGVPNSLNPSGEQWDFPNVWPPMQVSLN